jgi:hypothetical protein
MQRFLRDNDSLGTAPRMMYKEKERFGTTLGGCFSLCARCGLTFYVIVMVIAFSI